MDKEHQDYIGELTPLSTREILLDIHATLKLAMQRLSDHDLLLYGDAERQGLVERVRTLESMRRVLIWLSVTSAGLIITLLFAILTHKIELVNVP